jgi:hypothetical protein
MTNTETTIWTPEAVQAALARPGIRLETPQERAKWLDSYEELDFLVAEGDAERR